MVIDKQNIRKIPVYYHVPKCAGTFIAYSFLLPKLYEKFRVYKNESMARNKHFSQKFLRINLNMDNSLNFPGEIIVFAIINEHKFPKPEKNRCVLKLEEFKKYCEQSVVWIEGVNIKPITNGLIPKLLLIEKWCNITSCEPQYFTILRDPFDWNKSLFYYLRDKGTWERLYGVFKGMSFKDYIYSELIPDSWIIRNITGLPNNKPITNKEYNEAIQVLSKFKIGFIDDMPKFLAELTNDFGFPNTDSKGSNHLSNKNDFSPREKKPDLSKQDLKVFKDRTQYDQKLYNHFKSKKCSECKSSACKVPVNSNSNNSPKKKWKLLIKTPALGSVYLMNNIINSILTYYPDLFEPTKNIEDADFILLQAKNISYLDLGIFEDYKQKVILHLGATWKFRKNIRKGRLVDQPLFNKLLEHKKIITFAFMDAALPNVINFPLSFNVPKSISQPDNYWLEFDHNAHCNYYNKLYWSGSFTHESRGIINKLIKFNNPSFQLQFWKPIGQIQNEKVSVYSDNRPVSAEYIRFFSHLKNSDISLCIRGDKPWTHSFFDYLRASNAVAFIDTFYHKLGWEKIGLDKDKMFWFFDTSKDSSDKIYDILSSALQDKDEVIKKKRLAYNFYKKYIMTDRFYQAKKLSSIFTGWMDFYVAKILEIKENNYKLIDNCFFSQYIDLVKNSKLISDNIDKNAQNKPLIKGKKANLTIYYGRRAGLFSLLIEFSKFLYENNKKQNPDIVLPYWTKEVDYWDSEGHNGKRNVFDYYFQLKTLRRIEDYFPDLNHNLKSAMELKRALDNGLIENDTYNVKFINVPEKRFRLSREKILDFDFRDLFTVRPHIIKKVEKFKEENFHGKEIIGVHIRGPKHNIEMTPQLKNLGYNWDLDSSLKEERECIPYKEYTQLINFFINKNPNSKLFVATDDSDILNKFKKIYPNRVIEYPAFRPKSGEPHVLKRHNKLPHISGFKLGEDVLIEALLLANCKVLIHQKSNISDFIKVWNRNIITINVLNPLEYPRNLKKNLVRICSYGGSGSTMLIKFIGGYVRVLKKKEMLHNPNLMDTPSVNKYIYIFSNPLNSLISYFARNSKRPRFSIDHCINMDGNWQEMDPECNLKEYLKRKKDLYGLKDHLKKWKSMKAYYPIMFIKYETMWNHLGEIFEFLEIPRSEINKFPRFKERKSNFDGLEPGVKDELLKQYGELYEEYRNEKEIWIKNPKL